MGQTPAKMFNPPTPFGSSPNPNVLQQVQPQVQIPTAGVGFANTNQGDAGITQASASPATSPQDPGADMSDNPFLMRRRSLGNAGRLMS